MKSTDRVFLVVGLARRIVKFGRELNAGLAYAWRHSHLVVEPWHPHAISYDEVAFAGGAGKISL